MKKKGIVITVIGILLILTLLLVINNSDKPKTFREDGVLIALTVDGTNQTLFPSRGNYKVDIDCKNGKGKWLVDEWKFAVEEIIGNVTCYISFTTKTDTDNLTTKITSLKGSTSGTGSIVDEGTVLDENATFISTPKLEQSEYSNLTNDANYAWTWDETSKTWTSTNHDDSTTSEISFNPKKAGHYQICYIQSSETYNDYARIYKDNVEKFNLRVVSNTDYECEYLGELTTSNNIKVAYQKNSSKSTGNDNVIFYIKYKENFETISAGIRYEGQNPNNYIWFNNEMWRIIGVIPTKNASGTNENLVKIIRNESLGGYAYDAKSSGYTGVWGSNTLYILLNSYYWGKKDGTNTDYCYGYSNSAKSKCDYQVKGIKNTDYYGSMVREVYWNTGASGPTLASESYTNEIKQQTVKGYVGIINQSDYGYATSESHTKGLSSYGNSNYTLGNWLYTNSTKWTLTYSAYRMITPNVVSVSGGVGDHNTTPAPGCNVHPVVYLDSKVYVVSGDGSEANPYIVAMES